MSKRNEAGWDHFLHHIKIGNSSGNFLLDINVVFFYSKLIVLVLATAECLCSKEEIPTKLGGP